MIQIGDDDHEYRKICEAEFEPGARIDCGIHSTASGGRQLLRRKWAAAKCVLQGALGRPRALAARCAHRLRHSLDSIRGAVE